MLAVIPALGLIPPPPFSGFELGPLDVRLYGVVIAVGAYLALQLTVKRYEGFGGDPVVAEKAGLLALLVGFLGARIGYVIPRFFGEDGFVTHPEDILAIWQGGLAFFGGLTGGALAVFVYLRLRHGDVPAIADAVAPALPLAQALGRWGNYFNQELFGLPTDLPWALRVDPVPPSTAARFPGATTFHPTFLYESLWNVGLVLVILWIERAGWLKRRGSLMFVYLIGYGIGRGWIETLRVDTVERYLGLSRNNWIAIGIVLLGAVGLIVWERRGPRAEADPSEPSDGEPPATGTEAQDRGRGERFEDHEGGGDASTGDLDPGEGRGDGPR